MVDLGTSPLCETYIKPEDFNKAEHFYPLRVFVCKDCHLAQLEEFVTPEEIYGEYAYFSSFSTSWLKHASDYVEMIIPKAKLHSQSMVVELASNDGYLLQYVKQHNIPCLGIEPARNIADAANQKGIPTIARFFGEKTAGDIVSEYGKADLVIANNVLAHIPDINDFVKGIKMLLKEQGIATLEIPHLVQLIANNQFDTIYHEHYSYLSFSSASRIFAAFGLTLFDVDEIPTHGGSMRLYACHQDDPSRNVSAKASELLAKEDDLGVNGRSYYDNFNRKVQETKWKLLEALIDIKRAGKTIAGYGAPGKGNTLLNYCGIRTDLLEFTVDRNPYKHGRFLPGTRIPIFAPDELEKAKPDFILILPWNLKDEIIKQLDYTRAWGAKFIIPVPEVSII
jgi:2-polyprenyl-3-methyl-5-hydroxy-6-metoxy-1,4-benzoquinol methylase